MYDYLAEHAMSEAKAEYCQFNAKADFKTWLFRYMNDERHRSTVYLHNKYIFEWINDTFLIHEPAQPATTTSVAANKESLRDLLIRRLQWPLPFQGIQEPKGGGVPVNAVYCSLHPMEITPWHDRPQKCRVAFVLHRQLYTGYVWDFSREMEIAGVRL